MRELVARSPAAAAHVRTRVAVTFDPASRGEVTRVLHGTSTGAQAADLLAWADAGPVAADEPQLYDTDHR